MAPLPPELSSRASRERLRWVRWVHAVARGPLRAGALALGPGAAAAMEAQALESIWRGAAAEIGARVVLSCVREGLVEGERRSDCVSWSAPADAGLPLELPLERRGAFALDQPDLDPRALDPRVLDPAALIERPARRAGCSAADLLRVQAELRDSVFNLATARLADGLRPLLAARAPEDPRVLDPEHFVTDGHPWHPMTRTRLGLGPAGNLRHAPELLAQAPLSIVEVEAGEVQCCGSWLEVAQRRFGPAPRGWVRLPVHPRQLPHLPRLLPELVTTGRLRPTGSSFLRPSPEPIPARALASLRTVALGPTGATGDPDLHLKLATDIHTTSAKRVVSAMSVTNGPRVSALIERVQSRDPQTRRLELMAEFATAGLDPERHPRASALGAIFRRGPSRVEAETGAPVENWVCAAVGERWPSAPETLVLERACAGYPGDLAQRLDALMTDWLALLVPPCLRMLCAHGIALEVHLQNTLARIARGRLVGFAVRDLGGIRIHGPRLRAAGHAVELAPRSFILTDDLPEARDKLAHTLFHAHLTHVFAVAARLGLPLERSWARARAVVAQSLEAWSRDPSSPPSVRDAARVDAEALLAPQVRAKALLSMRLRERSSDYDYTLVDNALAAPP